MTSNNDRGDKEITVKAILFLSVLVHQSLSFLLTPASMQNLYAWYQRSQQQQQQSAIWHSLYTSLPASDITRRQLRLLGTINPQIDSSGNATGRNHNFHGSFHSTVTDVVSSVAHVLSFEDITLAFHNVSDVAAKLFTEPTTPPVCRIVTRAGSQLPNDLTVLPPELYQQPYCMLDKLESYYHAQARKLAQNEMYLRMLSTGYSSHHNNEDDTATNHPHNSNNNTIQQANSTVDVSTALRRSLEDAGFQLLSRRDLDLCESLNAGYLLRLSILPDVSQLDPTIVSCFYPECFYENGTLRGGSIASEDWSTNQDLLFDGRVLVYWRGYSQEITRGRLFLPKLDYLQTSVVQRSASWLKTKLDEIEEELRQEVLKQSKRFRRMLRRWIDVVGVRLRIRQVISKMQNLRWSIEIKEQDGMVPALDNIVDQSDSDIDDYQDENDEESLKSWTTKRSGSIRLGRYGGSKIHFVGSPNPDDALEPFTICEYNYDDPLIDATNNRSLVGNTVAKSSMNATVALCEHDMYEEVNENLYTCEYDAKFSSAGARKDDGTLPRMQLLERVSISNLVDIFTKTGRREVLKALVTKSKLVEPTYREVVVIWRPLIKHEKKKPMTPPLFVSEFADMLDIEGFDQPEEDKEVADVPLAKLEVRLFEQVPMSNLPAVLPKTKLVFRPADAFLFDLISLVTLFLVLSSVKFDSARLDLLALASVSFWVFRTFIRYSNKLARYDLLVKTFLTSKISQRNAGAFKYLSYEAASQRAIRAALVQAWIAQRLLVSNSSTLTREDLERDCVTEVNHLLRTDKEVQLDAARAIKDLEDLDLLTFNQDGILTSHRLEPFDSIARVKQLWADHLENDELTIEMAEPSFRSYTPEMKEFFE